MTRLKEKRTRLVVVRLTPSEFLKVEELYKKSSSKDLSNHLRKVILEQKITIYSRNQSLDEFMEELILLKKELNAIGVNFNQLVKQLNSMKPYDLSRVQLKTAQLTQSALLSKIEEINTGIHQFAALWLQKSSPEKV